MLKSKVTRFSKPFKLTFKILSIFIGIIGFAFGLYQFLEESKAREQLEKSLERLEDTEQRLIEAQQEIEKMQDALRDYEKEKAGVNAERDSLIQVWRRYLEELKVKYQVNP